MVLGILVGLALLMLFSMRGWSIFISAPICALLVALTSNMDLLGAYTGTFMEGTAAYIQAWFPTFMLGALFGKIMEDSGAAESLAKVIIKGIGKKRAILALIVSTSVLTYGGISLFVVVFAVYPLSLALFKEANLPKRLIPGCITTGAFSFTAIALPGSPQLQNIIPTRYFGTDPMAAPIMGLICAIVIFSLSVLYMNNRAKGAQLAGEGFVPGPNDRRFLESNDEVKNIPSPILSILPLITIIVLLNVIKLHIVVSLSAGIVIGLLLFFKYFETLKSTINTGVQNSMLAILNTAFAVGFGAVVKIAPGFAEIIAGLEKLSFGNPLIYEFVAVNALAGVTGSASGGLSIALEVLAQRLLETGINPAILHRVASLSANGLDSLPHCGAVLTLFAICGLSHKDSYRDVFVCTILITIIGAVLAVILGTIGIA